MYGNLGKGWIFISLNKAQLRWAVRVAGVHLSPVWCGQPVFCSVCTYYQLLCAARYRLNW